MHYFLDPRNHTASEFVLPAPPVPGKRPVVRSLPPPRPDAFKLTYESLGTDEMDGLIVDGRRETMTIPAGKEGNDRPIAVVTD